MSDQPRTTIPGWPKCSSCSQVSTRDGGPCTTCRSKAAVQGHLYDPGPRDTPGQLDSWVRCTVCGETRWQHQLHDGTRELADQLEAAARGDVVAFPRVPRYPGEQAEHHRVRQADARRSALETDHAYLHRAARPTSVDAAEQARLTSGSARRRVLEGIVAAGEPGATDEELQARLAMPANTQRPRRLELVEAGYVMDSGDERPTASGASAIVWLPTVPGLLALEEADRG